MIRRWLSFENVGTTINAAGAKVELFLLDFSATLAACASITLSDGILFSERTIILHILAIASGWDNLTVSPFGSVDGSS
jgi:hypothetical protein